MNNVKNNLFSDLASAMSASIADVMNDAGSVAGLAKEVAAASKLSRAALDVEKILQEMNINNSPINIFETEDGVEYVEVAIPGKTKENVKITAQSAQTKPLPPHLAQKYSGCTFLRIEVTAGEQTDEQKKLAEARKNGQVRIKGMSMLSVTIPVDAGRDINGLKAKVENGLLTVTIPSIPDLQPKEFSID